MNEALTQLGVGGIFAILVIDKVLTRVGEWRKRNNCPGNPGRPCSLEKMMLDDPPRKHTELLTEIARETRCTKDAICAMHVDLKQELTAMRRDFEDAVDQDKMR